MRSFSVQKMKKPLSSGSPIKNGSPPPTFKTDSERHYLETTIWIHEGFEIDEGVDNDVNRDANGANCDANDDANHNQTELDECEALLIEQIRSKSDITYDEIVKNTGLSRKTVERRMQGLKEKGILRRIGGTRGSWEVIR